MEENIKQHFRPNEGAFIDQVADWISTASGQYRPVLTSFLNPRQRYIARTMANAADEVKMASAGVGLVLKCSGSSLPDLLPTDHGRF